MSETGRLHFDLATEPWIPVRWRDGTVGEVSLATALKEAGSIGRILGDIPQQELPIIRVMLAVLYHAMPPADTIEGMEALWQGVWRRGSFDPGLIDGYLGGLKGRFDLFDARHPFFQVPTLEYVKGGHNGVVDLVADVQPLYASRDPATLDSLTPAEAARWLVFKQAYDVAGIKSPVRGNTHVAAGKVYAPKAVSTGVLGATGPVWLEGESLFETLMLNWVLFDDRAHGHALYGNPSDLAAWERDDVTCDMVVVGDDRPAGPVDLLTWQGRRVRLVADDAGRVIGVVRCYGDVLPSLDDRQDVETMTAWREVKRPRMSRTVLVPRRHDPTRAVWRGLAPLVAYDGGSDLRPGVVRWVERLGDDGVLAPDDLPSLVVRTQGMTYTQGTVYDDAIDDGMRIARIVVDHDSEVSQAAVAVIGQVERGVNRYCTFLRRVWRASGRKTDGSANQTQATNAAMDRERELAYARLDQLCRQRLASFPTEGVDAWCDGWREEVRRLIGRMADDYLATHACSAFQGHDGMTVGEASSRLRRDLWQALGPTTTREGQEEAK